MSNLPTAPALNNPSPDDNSSSDHESDHEESSDIPDTEVELHDSPQQNLRDYQLARDRSRRNVRPPARYAYSDLVYCALVAGMELRCNEPSSYEEAISSQDSTKWQCAMEEEMASLITNNTWVLVPRPQKQKLIRCKWLFKIKEGMLSTDPLRFKARLVAKGFT